MSLISYTELCELIEQKVIIAPISAVNASSINITLDKLIRYEQCPSVGTTLIDITDKNRQIQLIDYDLSNESEFIMTPGKVVLASSVEVFNLPDNISAEYKLRSSMARNFFEHLNAGWCDAGWHGSKLTLEFKNMSQWHSIILRAGMPAGQVVFFRHTEVPEHASYAKIGRYNNQKEVTSSKGV